MEFIKNPVKGMADLLPGDVRLRARVLNMIREAYGKYGFMEIETPAMEHLSNLTNKQGGENEKLIFKILKRGNDFQKALEAGNEEFADNGLRYDLTVPLARYYAKNADKLPSPFKAFQIGSVWRADKPQKGRFRQFTQCDIDILGDNTILAEIELIAATADMLSSIFAQASISEFTIHISDRRILKAMAKHAGFNETDYDAVFIILDKLDKIGVEGIKAELIKANYQPEAIERYVKIFEQITKGVSCKEFCEFLFDGCLEPSVADDVDTIISCVRSMVSKDVKLVFDPTLVRGMSYYTGTIFECSIDGYSFSIAGGGRYDEMIEKFSGMKVCACGFSIGFERIITILKDHLSAEELGSAENHAILIDKGVDTEKMTEMFQKAKEMREKGTTVTVQPMKKNLKHQIKSLEAEGYSTFDKIYADKN